MLKTLSHNTLFYGDNLDILREYIASESVDLVYLDPPFSSQRNYNVLFKNDSGNSPGWLTNPRTGKRQSAKFPASNFW